MAEKSQSNFARNPFPASNGSKLWRLVSLGSVIIGGGLLLLWSCHLAKGASDGVRYDPLSAASYRHLAGHCSAIPPISHAEFISRQTDLAKVLHSMGASAYIAEPGANTQFFGNFSKAQWSLSERPLLLIITPMVDRGKILPQVTILSPKFEATRAKLLPAPSLDGNINYLAWAEDEDPYVTALSVLPVIGVDSHRKLFVDNSIRKFIVDGLYQAAALVSGKPHQTTGFSNIKVSSVKYADRTIDILSAPEKITEMRERKSATEIEILKCVNEVTLLAIRDVHRKLVPGIHESYARNMMSVALGAAGLKDGGCLTLFGENAALPHGSGTDRILGENDFALFDCTASLHGYYSDVTRTVALSPYVSLPPVHVAIWHRVRQAQLAALHTAQNGTRTDAVDAAARHSLLDADLARYFTHRLGHGIGLEVHEAPYLRGGSSAVIAVGHAFSDEPGVYIEGKVGVRLEDCFFINEEGKGELFTAGVGGFSEQPWLP